MKSLYSFLSRVNSASNVKLSTSIATNPTENLLKKFILRTAGVFALLLVFGGSVMGQCTSATYGQYPTTTYTPTTSWASIATNCFGGEYSLINVTCGKSYSFRSYRTSNSANRYTTITNGDGTSVLGFALTNNTTTTLTWVATYTGTVRMYSHLDATCAASSTSITRQVIAVNGSVPAQPSIITGNTSLCSSTSSTYSVTNVIGVTYTWTYSGTGTITGTGNSITLNATTSGTLTVTPSNCVGNGTASTLSITVNNTSNPSGTISNDAASCGNVTLTYSSPSSDIYWQTSASGTSTASPTTSSYSLASSGTIFARAYNSTTTCWSSSTVSSGAISVYPTAPATVSIAASPSGAICTGTSVTYTPTASTPSNTNSYIWYVNNVQVGTSNTYSTSSLVNGDQVSCQLTTSSPCATVPTASSNTLTMSVSSFPTTQASIMAYTNNNSGTGVTVNWTRGDGVTGVIVVARATATAAVEPSSGTTYTANATFGSGTGSAITGSGNFVVYVGTGTSVAVTGLTGNTGYTFTVYEYSNTCYLAPGSSSSVSTPLENAISFDGTDDRVNCGTASSIDITGTSITLEAWIYPTAWRTFSYEGSIINKESTSNSGYMLRCGASGTLSFNFGNGTSWVELLSSSGALALNTWQHVAGTYDGTTLRLYKNGVLLTSSNSTASIASTTSAQQLTIGNWSQSNTRGFIGLIDEVRIWNVARSASELTCGMTEVPDISNTALKARYSFNQGVANGTNTGVTTLTDATANANNGTLANFTLTGTSSNWVVGKSGIQSAASCSGTPTPGATTTSAATVNSTSTVVSLGLTSATCGSGVTYQWMSSTDGTNYTNIPAATGSSYSTTISVSTYFKCAVTCSGNTGTSTAVLVTLTYCNSTGPASQGTDYFTNFTTTNGILNISNASTYSSNGYGNFTAQIVSQNPGNSVNYSMTSPGVGNGTSFGIFIDWNGDFDFADAGESVYNSNGNVSANPSGSFTVPIGTSVGTKRMRIVCQDASAAVGSCNAQANGETEDYSFNVVSSLISASGSLSAFTTCSGSVSTSQSFTVSGTNLGASLVVTAITGFEVSTSQNGTYSTSVSYTPVSGTVSSQTVWVRLTSTATGNPSGNIAVSSTGGTTQNIAVSGTVNATPTSVTVTGGAICSGATITAAGGTGGTIYWQGTSSNGTSTSIGSGATSPAISSAGTYYARSQSAEGCWGAEGSASVTITPIPSCIGAGFAPANASSSVNPVVGATITWSAVADATSYDVYFGTDNTPTNIANGVNQIGLSYETGALTEATTYYWMIVPKNSCGAASNCSVYSFTTTSACTAPTISSTSNVNINCFNGSTGSITVNATGGVTGYEYSKDNGATWQSSNIFGSLSVGSYIIVVKGGDACVGAPSTVTLTQPAAALSVNASGSGSGCGGSTLTLSSTVVGGTSPYTYLWSNSGGLNDATIASPTATIGSYASHTLTVTDNNGCTATSSAVTITNNSPSAPTVTTPAAICQGQSADLNATSSGNSINWYTVSSGGTAIFTLANSGSNNSVSPSITTTYYAESVVTTPGSPTTQSFNYSGSIVNWTVPNGVTSITITAKGAQGGSVGTGGVGGSGANLSGTFAVTPSQVLSILVGQQPTGSGAYAAGGGGTFVALGSNYATATPLIVAGGGGGGNTTTGGNAQTGTSGAGLVPGTSGNGAPSTSCGGGGGGFYTSGGNDNFSGSTISYGGSGFRQGGAGGTCSGYQTGGFGGGAAPNFVGSCNMKAGAGGGYSGGSGLNSGTSTNSGFGGGSYNGGTNTSSSVNNTGNGVVTITYSLPVAGCASLRTPVTITVNEAPTANAGSALSAICQGQTSAAMGGSIGGTATSGIWSGGAGTWTNASDPANATYTAGASESGTITLTLTPSGGSCPAIVATKTLVVNSNPASLTITPASATICSGSSQSLSIGSAINANYQFSSSSGTYSALSGGSVNTSTATGDDASQSAISLGFDFLYGGSTFNQFGVSTNGVIQLGSTTTNALTNALASTANIITPMWDDNNTASGSVKYLVSGTSPNRVLTVEWFNVAIGGGGVTTSSTNNFQAKLYETTNVIQFIYGNGMSSSNGISASIGISTAVGSYLSVTPGATPSASSTSENASVSSVTNLTSGTTYTFTPISVTWSPVNTLFTNAAATAAYAGTSTSTLYAKPTETTTYTVTSTSSVGCNSSSTVQVTLTPISVAGTASSDQTICTGGTPLDLTLASNTGTIQWQVSSDNATFTNVTSATTSSLTSAQMGALTSTKYYRAVVTNGVCSPINSNTVTATVIPDPVITNAANSYTYCVASPVEIASTATGGTGTMSYRWQYSADGTTWSAVADNTPTSVSYLYDQAVASNNVLSLSNLQVGTYSYRFRQNNTSAGCASNGATITLTIVADPSAPTATKSPNAANACVGQTLTLTSVTDNGGGTGTCNIEYCYSTDGGASYTAWSTSVPSILATGADNRIKIRKNCGGTGCDLSSETTYSWTLDPTSVAGTASSDQTICSGVTPTALSLNGNTGTIQWQSSTTSSSSGFTNISSATNATLTLGALTTTTYYRAMVTSGVCSTANSNAVTITVNAIPSAPTVTVADNCNNTSTISTTATGTLLWSTTETTSEITVSTAGTYTVTQTVNGCTSAAGSGVAAPKSTPATPVVSVVNDCGESTLSFTPAANATILWSNNATTASTTTVNSETLTVVQTVNGCPSSSVSGNAVPLVIPSAPTATASQNFCVTDNATVGSLAYTSVVGNTYTWYDAATAGNTVATSTQLPTATTTYYLSTTGSNGCTSTTRTAVAATESAQALATVSITGTTVCPGGEIQFTATPVNGGPSPSYQWYNGGVPIQNETGNTYIATGLSEGAVITVKMIPSGSCVTVCPN